MRGRERERNLGFEMFANISSKLCSQAGSVLINCTS